MGISTNTQPIAVLRRPENVSDVRLARSRKDLLQAFQLTYDSYYQAGLSVDNPSGLRLTPYHLLENSEVLVATSRNKVISTLSMFGDADKGLPMQAMYPGEIKKLRDRGRRMAEVGSFADRRSSSKRFIDTFTQLYRWLAQVAAARNFDTLVVVAHPKHARLYKRMFGFRQIGEATECPYANGNPAVALYLELDKLNPDLHQQVFGDPIAVKELMPYRWPETTRQYFRHILECDGKIAATIGLNGYYNWGAVVLPPLSLTPILNSTTS